MNYNYHKLPILKPYHHRCYTRYYFHYANLILKSNSYFVCVNFWSFLRREYLTQHKDVYAAKREARRLSRRLFSDKTLHVLNDHGRLICQFRNGEELKCYASTDPRLPHEHYQLNPV